MNSIREHVLDVLIIRRGLDPSYYFFLEVFAKANGISLELDRRIDERRRQSERVFRDRRRYDRRIQQAMTWKQGDFVVVRQVSNDKMLDARISESGSRSLHSHLGDIVVADSLGLKGIVTGRVTVTAGGQLVLYGRCGELVVERDAVVSLHGIVLGKVINRGGRLRIKGMVPEVLGR